MSVYFPKKSDEEPKPEPSAFRMAGPSTDALPEDPTLAVCEAHGIFFVELRHNQQTGYMLQIEHDGDEAEADEDELLAAAHPELGLQVLLFRNLAAVGQYIQSTTWQDNHADRLRSWWADLSAAGEPQGYASLNLDHLPLFLDMLRAPEQLTLEDEEDLVPFLFHYGELVYHLPDPGHNEEFVNNHAVNQYLEAFFQDISALHGPNSQFDMGAFRATLLGYVEFFKARLKWHHVPRPV